MFSGNTGHPDGVFVEHPGEAPLRPNFDPFDSPDESPLLSPSSSEEDLYNKLALQEPLAPQPVPARRAPPPPPPPRGSKPQVKDS